MLIMSLLRIAPTVALDGESRCQHQQGGERKGGLEELHVGNV